MVRSSAAERQAHALAWKAAQPILADDDVAREQVVAAGALRERAVARVVAARLDEVADPVADDAPMARGDEIDRRHRIRRVARCAVANHVAFDHAPVGKEAIAPVDLELRVEVNDLVAAGGEVGQ